MTEKQEGRIIIHKKIIAVMVGLLSGTSVLAQKNSEEMPNPCTVTPIFHCAESMGDGNYLGHFGYRASCPDSDKPIKERFVEIGDENYFSPGSTDRGQPKIFISGDHVDEFEVEFSAAEIQEAKEFGWTVLKNRITVDLSRIKDGSLDCANLPY